MSILKPFIISLTLSCSTAAYVYAGQGIDSNKVMLLYPSDTIPQGARRISAIYINNLRSYCNYTQALEEAKEAVFIKKANVLRIAQVKTPDALTSWFRIKGEAYYVDNIEEFARKQDKAVKERFRQLLPDTASYALLCVYRPHVSGRKPFKLKVNDSLYRIDDKSSRYIKLYNDKTTVTGVEGTTRFLTEPGKIYFLRYWSYECSISRITEFEIVDPMTGLKESEEIQD